AAVDALAPLGGNRARTGRVRSRMNNLLLISPPLEELDRALVSLGGGTARECPEIASPAGFRIFLPRIESIFARRESADHDPALTTSLTHRQQSTHTTQDLRPHLGLRIDEDKMCGGRKHRCDDGVAGALRGRLVGRYVLSEHSPREKCLRHAEW